MTHQSRILTLFYLIVVFVAGSRPISADTISTFQLNTNIASGTFSYDFTNGALLNWQVFSFGTPLFGTQVVPHVTPSSVTGGANTQLVSVTMEFVTDTPFTSTHGANITIDPTQSFAVYDTGTAITVAATSPSSVDLVRTIETPDLAAISPNPISAGSPDTILTCTGTNFTSTSVIYFGGTLLATTYVSPTKATALLPASYIRIGGIIPVMIIDPATGFNSGKTVNLTLNPTITSIMPNSVVQNKTTTITVNGAGYVGFFNYYNNSIVLWNGKALATTYITNNQLTAVVPASLVANVGTAQVKVSLIGGGLSNAIPVVITASLPKLSLISVSAIRNADKSITIMGKVTNTGTSTAPSASVTNAQLGAIVTTSGLPLPLGDIVKSQSVPFLFNFPGSVGKAGTIVTLSLTGIYTGGTWNAHLNVKLP